MTWLSDDDKRRFGAEGYLVIPQVVPESLLTLVDAEIDEFLDELALNDPDALQPGPHGGPAPVSKLPRCDDVLRLSPALTIAQELVKPNTLDHALGDIQVATTIPIWPHAPGGPHIDGQAQDPPKSFTMLAGVLLTEQRGSQSGNLWVWPGSHLRHQEFFRERGTKVLLETGGHPTLLDPPLLSGPAVELHGGRGDLVLAHFLLGHNRGGNQSDHVRRTIYYRLAVPGHAERWEETFLDAWTEYPDVRRAIAST